MALLTPQYSATRAVKEYTTQRYLPAALACQQRTANNGLTAHQLMEWKHTIEKQWTNVRIGEVTVNTENSKLAFKARVFLNGLDANNLCVQLYAEGVKRAKPEIHDMVHSNIEDVLHGWLTFYIHVPSKRPANDYTVRIIPRHTGIAVPLECSHILWQK